MRFTATIGDAKAVDVFFKIVVVVSKLSKKRCVVRITPTELSFVNVYSIREGMHMDFRIHKDHLFNTWNFDGLSPDNNAIFFELSTEDLIHSLHARESQIKLKMTKKDQVPHLRIELSQNSLVNEIPLTLILVRQWPEYDPPNMGMSHLVVSLPPIKIIAKIIAGMKEMGGRSLLFRANNRGEFNIITHAEMAKVAVYAQGLNNQTMSGAENLSQSAYQSDHFFDVTLDLRTLYAFVSTLHTYATRLTMKIVEDHGAVFTAHEPECNLTLYLAGINRE